MYSNSFGKLIITEKLVGPERFRYREVLLCIYYYFKCVAFPQLQLYYACRRFHIFLGHRITGSQFFFHICRFTVGQCLNKMFRVSWWIRSDTVVIVLIPFDQHKDWGCSDFLFSCSIAKLFVFYFFQFGRLNVIRYILFLQYYIFADNISLYVKKKILF